MTTARLLLAALLATPAPALAIPDLEGGPVAVPASVAPARAPRLVARHRAHHVLAIDAQPCDGGWKFFDGTLGRPYQLLGTLTRRAGTEVWQVDDHIGRPLGTIEPEREGWAIFDHDHARIGAANTREVHCPNGRKPPRHRKKGFPEIAMHAFFGPDAE